MAIGRRSRSWRSSSSVVIRKPLRTRNRSTPRKPPGNSQDLPARHQERGGVVQHDERDRDGAKAVERGPIAEPRAGALAAKIGDDAGVIAIRAVLLTVALAACAWFALGVRAAHDQDAATSLLDQHNSLTPATGAHGQGRDRRRRDPQPRRGARRSCARRWSSIPATYPARWRSPSAWCAGSRRTSTAWFVLELISRQDRPGAEPSWPRRASASSCRPVT